MEKKELNRLKRESRMRTYLNYKLNLPLLFTLLLCMFSSNTFAYDAYIDGIYYNFSGDSAEVTYEIPYWPSYYDDNVVIPSTVSSYGKTYRVTSIGYGAFSGCSGLTSITIPEGLTSIGAYAFSGCSDLTSINIPKGVARIYGYTFQECTALKTVSIGNGVKEIDGYAFYKCGELTALSIPASVMKIYVTAFLGCNALASIKVESGNTKYDSRDNCNAIIETQSNTLIKGCNNTTIPNSVTSIGGYAFSGCSGLNSVTIPSSVTSISKNAFQGCTGLTSVTIPNSVTSISESAFQGCTGLTSVTIPNSVTSIGDYAFYDCSDLTSVTLNSNALVSKTYSTSNSFCSFFDYHVQEYVIGEGVTSIGDYAFNNCSGLTSINIPKGITSIGQDAFSGCTKLDSLSLFCDSIGTWFSGMMSITKLNIGEGVKVVSSNAFDGCSNISAIEVDTTLSYIGKDAFNNTAWYNSQPNGLVYAGLVAYKYKGTLQEHSKIVLKKGTKGIVEAAFAGCTGLEIINIPNSLTCIGKEAFYDCSFLTSITIPEGVKEIGEKTFYGCSNMTSVFLPKSVTCIGSSAFYNCSNLASFSIPSDVDNIGESAFYNCKSLSSITIPKGVSWIENELFYGCSSLTSITIPKGVSNIGQSAFKDCVSLTSITIPNTVDNIDDSAFAGCEQIKDFYCYAAAVPTTSVYAFTNQYIRNATLHVPAESVEDYGFSDPWYNFGSIVALTEEEVGIGEIQNDNLKVGDERDLYDLSGRKLSTFQRGINIIHNNDGTTKKIVVK